MRALLRLLIWLKDSIPLYSYRDCARSYFNGYDCAKMHVGLDRSARGKFVSLKKSRESFSLDRRSQPFNKQSA